jgi:hypothetical protein
LVSWVIVHSASSSLVCLYGLIWFLAPRAQHLDIETIESLAWAINKCVLFAMVCLGKHPPLSAFGTCDSLFYIIFLFFQYHTFYSLSRKILPFDSLLFMPTSCFFSIGYLNNG